MSSLYELTDEYKVVEDILYDPEVDEQTVIDTLEAISGGGLRIRQTTTPS